MNHLQASDLCDDCLPTIPCGASIAVGLRILQESTAAWAVVIDGTRYVRTVHVHDLLNASSETTVEHVVVRRQVPSVTGDAELAVIRAAFIDSEIETVLVVTEQGEYRGAIPLSVMLGALPAVDWPVQWPDAMLDQLPLAMWSTDTELRYTSGRGRGLSVLGTSARQVIGRTMKEFLGVEAQGVAAITASQRALQGESTAYEMEWQGRWFRANVQPLKADSGEIAGTVGVALDISDLKEAAFALRASEARFRRIAESNMLGILFWSSTGEITDANDAFLRMIGYTRADLEAGRICWTDLTPSEFLHRDREALEEIARTGCCTPFEKKYIHRAGHCIDVLLGAASLDADVTHGVCFTIDITERKRIEQTLADSEERYRLLVEFNPVAIIIHRGGRFLFANPAALNLFGARSMEEIIGSPVMDRVHPDFVPLVIERLASLGQHQPAGLLREKMLTFDGRVIDVEVVGTPIVLNGEEAVQTVILDVTDRVRAEESLQRIHEELENRVRDRTAELAEANRALQSSEARLKSLIAQSPISTQVMSPDGTLENVNRAFENLWGVTLDDLRGYNLFNDPQLREQGIVPYLERARAGESILLPQVPYHPDRGRFQGQIRWTNARIYPVMDEAGQVREIVILHEDITERMLAEDEVRQLGRKLEQTSRLRVVGEMTAGIAHELHQPLQVIANYASGCVRRLAAGDLADADLTETLQEIAHEAVHARRVVQRIKQLIQQREPSRSVIEINEIVRDVARLSNLTVAENDVRMHVRHECEPATVLADAVALTQAVLNLVLNAVEAMRDAPHRELILTVSAPDAAHVAVSVTDTGHGIQKDMGQKIFDQFFTTKPEGLGLGLAISRSIAQAHDGQLTYVSREQRGTTFVLTLPRERS